MRKTAIFILLQALFLMSYAQKEALVVRYDNAFVGEKTASGEIFSQDKLSAAHDSIPLGTKIELYNVVCKKRVVVTVNDRLENAPGLFWISQAAYDTLGFASLFPGRVLYAEADSNLLSESLKSSTVWQEMLRGLGENCEKPQETYAGLHSRGIPKADEEAAYAIQIYATEKRSDALELSRRFADYSGYLSYIERAIVDDQMLYRVLIGDFSSSEKTHAIYNLLSEEFPHIMMLEIY